jgi:myo-inositol 2-dehydrogenase/D-chiro-inositol 1-dehydrogenase
VKGVVICTSTDTHVELIELAARQGKAVFCEKPIDLDMAKVDRCLEAVARAGVPLFIGFNRRFDPSFRALRDALARGEAGRLEVLRITSRDPSPPPAEYVKVSGGLFRDMMIHDLDMARFLLPEPPVEVFATGACLVDPAIGAAGDVDTAVVVLRTAAGVLCTIDNSRRAAYGYDQRIEAFGSLGMIAANNVTATTLVRASAAGVVTDRPLHFFLERYAEAYRAELEHFVDVLEGRAAPSVTGGDGRAALALADAAARSLAEGRIVRL